MVPQAAADCAQHIPRSLFAPLDACACPQKSVSLSGATMAANVSPVFTTCPLHRHDGVHEISALGHFISGL